MLKGQRPLQYPHALYIESYSSYRVSETREGADILVARVYQSPHKDDLITL